MQLPSAPENSQFAFISRIHPQQPLLASLGRKPCRKMERQTSAGPSSELQHTSTILLDDLDDPLLGRVLFLAGKPSWCVRQAAAAAGGTRNRQRLKPLLPDITTLAWLA